METFRSDIFHVHTHTAAVKYNMVWSIMQGLSSKAVNMQRFMSWVTNRCHLMLTWPLLLLPDDKTVTCCAYMSYM